MKKILTFAVVALALVGTGYCKGPTVSRDGIVINRIGAPQEMALGGLKGFTMAHPTIDVSGANVGCLVDEIPDSMSWDEYINISCSNVQNMASNKPNCQVIGTTRAILDYRINMLGNDIHIYQLIIRDDDQAHVITAAMSENSWKSDVALKNELIDCVHSAHVK